MMKGLGFDAADFADGGDLHPGARVYRDFLREASAAAPWQAAVGLLTIFVEGSVHERAELEGTYERKRGEDTARAHPLVVHYGCPIEAMELARAHAAVEGGHRRDAWRIVLDHTPEGSPESDRVAETCERALVLWHAYRDGVAAGMGLTR